VAPVVEKKPQVPGLYLVQLGGGRYGERGQS
jgi:hypothetical protein